MTVAGAPGLPSAEAAALREMAVSARRAARVLSTTSEATRNAALAAMAAAVTAAHDGLLAANAQDMLAAEARAGADALSSATLARLRLTPAKLQEMAEQIVAVAALPDPLGRVLQATELDDADQDAAGPLAHGLHLEKLSVPLGVLAVIFEARPDAVTQIAALALKSGNAAILKPGSEVQHTATALVQVLRQAIAPTMPADALQLVSGRDAVLPLLGMHDLIDMVIPRGSKTLVEFVQAHTRIPVLGHAEGVCHIYVDDSADPAMALRLIDDAKTDYPAACNAVETVLVHRGMAAAFVPQVVARLQSRQVKVFGDEAVRAMLPELALVTDWQTEYGELAVSLGIVESLDAALEHIATYGSKHTDTIVTGDLAAAERFLLEVDAASVLHNASTRFADGFRYGFGAEVGVSTSKFHARGPVGLDGLTTYKYVVRGHGHIAGDYRGAGARAFTHRKVG